MGQGFRKLTEAYRDRIYTFALYSLRSREDAEEVTQDVLVKLWRHREHVSGGAAGAWVMRVARNAVIDVLRRRRTRSAAIADEIEVEVADSHYITPPDVEGRVESREFRQALEVALAGLVEPYRSIIVMREIQELKYAEISEALEMPLNTVKVYVHRGRRMLRDALKGTVQRDAL